MSKPPCGQQQQQPHQHFSQFNIPQSQASAHPQIISQSTSQHLTIHPPPIIAQMMPHQRPNVSTQIVATPLIDQSPYLTAIPVQPVFPTTATVLSPLHVAPDYAHPNLVLTPNQNQIQDHLQRKHEELQKLIAQQQDELRKVSEQLFMARYGIIPSIVNVSVPFAAPMEHLEAGESTSSHMSHSTYHEPHPPMMHHPSQSQANPQIHPMHQQHPPIQYEMKLTPSELQAIDDEQQNENIMQYIQHQNQPPHSHQMSQPMHQQQHDEFGMAPFQMMNQQAQILFTTGNNNDSANTNSSSNK